MTWCRRENRKEMPETQKIKERFAYQAAVLDFMLGVARALAIIKIMKSYA